MLDHPDPQPMSATRAGCAEPGDEAGDLGEPLLGELVEEHGPVDPLDEGPELLAVGGVFDAAAGAEGVQYLGQRPGDAGQALGEWRHEGEAVGIGQHLSMPQREAEPAAGRDAAAAGGEDAGDGLLVEPFPGVAFGDPRTWR